MMSVRVVTRAAVVALAAMLLATGAVQADITISTVPVGNTGNTADPETGYGAVDYNYNIGKYEVTAGQYTAFLNAVAKTDTYGLYYTFMWSDAYGCKIKRSGSSGAYTYSVASDRADRPVNYVCFWDACRFANWLHNGQPTGLQDAGTTEDGAYTLNGYHWDDGQDIQRNPDWTWAVPSEDEWYKAAYHKNDGDTGNYFDYPTASDTMPSNHLIDPDPGNNANFWDGDTTIDPTYWRTEVGEFENSESPYGTFDQGGNVVEWNETIPYKGEGWSYRGLRGGNFNSMHSLLLAAYRAGHIPTRVSYGSRGFRVVQIPEPTTLALLALGGAGVLMRLWRR